MPAQLSTVLYVSQYNEKISSSFIIGNATAYTRLAGDEVQTFNVTAFYPLDETNPCYLPKIKEGQVLSVANSKFTKNNDNSFDVS